MEGISLITDVGIYMHKFQQELIKKYSYRVFSYDEAIDCMRKYVLSLPKGFHLNDDSIPVKDNPEINYAGRGFEIVKDQKFPIVSRCGTLIASSFNRIVIGYYGAFIEIDPDDIYRNNIKTKPGQEYRINSRKFREKVKYYWYTAKDKSDCNIFYQKKPVAYADYIPEMYYISVFEVLDIEELRNYLLNFEEEDMDE